MEGGNHAPPYMGVSQNYGYLFEGPHNKDYSILGSILGSPYFGKLPYTLNPNKYSFGGSLEGRWHVRKP